MIRAAVRQFRPDVVHLHSSRAGLVGRLAGAGRPVVFQPHGWSFYPLRSWRRAAALRIERRLAAATSAFAMCSQLEHDEGVAAGVPITSMVVVGNVPSVPAAGPDRSLRRAAREALGIELGRPVYLAVGRLAPQKAPDRIAAAWAEISDRSPDALLLLVGEGSFEFDLPGVVHHGFQDDVTPYLDAADALLHLARWEGLPIAVLDAMARGLPVVASRETISAADLGGAGTVVDGDDPVAVADAATERGDDPELRRLEGKEGLEMIRKRFNEGALRARMSSLYEAASAGPR